MVESLTDVRALNHVFRGALVCAQGPKDYNGSPTAYLKARDEALKIFPHLDTTYRGLINLRDACALVIMEDILRVWDAETRRLNRGKECI